MGIILRLLTRDKAEGANGFVYLDKFLMFSVFLNEMRGTVVERERGKCAN